VYSTKEASFWRDVFSGGASSKPVVLLRSLVFVALAVVIAIIEKTTNAEVAVEVAPYEYGGAILGLLLVMRTNAGYERWWEARRLWGDIINQARTLAITALSEGPNDPKWRREFASAIASIGWVVKAALRNERVLPDVARLMGAETAEAFADSAHMPTELIRRIALHTRIARQNGCEQVVFLRLETEREPFLRLVGACERIRTTPLPSSYSYVVRRFIFFFLCTLPFALHYKVSGWPIPLITFLTAYPILALDQIGAELQNPFDASRLNHLPLEDFCSAIERDALDLYASGETPHPSSSATPS
jgi:ion channel-forming bestrophin family protein